MGAVGVDARDGDVGRGDWSAFGTDGEVRLAGLTAGRTGCGVKRTVGDTGAAGATEAGVAGNGFTDGTTSARGRTGRRALRGSAVSCPTPPSGRDPAARRAVRRNRSKGSSGSAIFSANHDYLFRFRSRSW